MGQMIFVRLLGDLRGSRGTAGVFTQAKDASDFIGVMKLPSHAAFEQADCRSAATTVDCAHVGKDSEEKQAGECFLPLILEANSQ